MSCLLAFEEKSNVFTFHNPAALQVNICMTIFKRQTAAKKLYEEYVQGGQGAGAEMTWGSFSDYMRGVRRPD